jgi:hypothetical protein
MIASIRSAFAATCLAATALLAPAAWGQVPQPPNLVVNGDFTADGGSLDGWTYNTNTDNFYWQYVTNGTTDYASNGCLGAVCITGTEAEQNYLYQTINTIPGLKYKLTFSYDAGTGGVNELKVLAGDQTLEDIVNANQGANTYTVEFVAHRFDTVLNFLGRQDNGFSFLTAVSVTCAF